MTVFGILGLLAGFLGVPRFAASLRQARLEAWLCAGAGLVGLILVAAVVEPGLGTAALLLSPVVFGSWLALWSAVGWARRRREG